jgi:protein-tyrosine-phosphatase
MTPYLLFVCVANRVRSTFAEFYLRDRFSKRGEHIAVCSAGFIPQVLKDRLAESNIPFPDPFYNRPMSEVTMATLLKKGIKAPEGWRSKALTPEKIEEADLIITALSAQKQDLCSLYQRASERILTIRDLSGTDECLFSEDFSILTFDENFWNHVDEDVEYVSRILGEWEAILDGAIPGIIEQLGNREE